MGMGTGRSSNKKLSDSDAAFLRAPENREFAKTLNIDFGKLDDKGELYAKSSDIGSIQSAILGQKSLIEGRKYFAPREAQAVNPLVLEALQRSMAQQPVLAGFETQMAQMAQLPQFQQTAQPSFAQPNFAQPNFAQPQIGGMQGGLLGSLATKGQQQIAAGQAMNPTILKAKSV